MLKAIEVIVGAALLSGYFVPLSLVVYFHFYCELGQITLDQQIREKLLSELPVIDGAGPVRSRPVGPHPLPMFETWFTPGGLDEVRAWAEKNRQGLSVMIHPITGDDYRDHAEGVQWMGKVLPLNLEILKNL
jgi:DOPA 4,5-dioxygenase